MTKILKGNIIFTKSPTEFTIVNNGFIVINSNKVVDVFEELPAEYKDFNIINYGDKLIIPGMNDLHCHAPQFRNLGMSMDKELLPWLNGTTFPEESKYEDLDYATKMYKKFVKDIWKNGTTRIVVFATIHKEASIKLLDLFSESGLGAYVGKVNMDRNCCDELIEDTKKSLLDTEDILIKYKDTSIVKPIVTPRFIPCCSNELLKGLGELCLKYNIKNQSHMSENLSEIDWVKELHPDTNFYGEAYNKYNLFGQTPTLMAHCVYSSLEEVELMRKNNVMAVHCPDSNLNLASGTMPIRKFLDSNVKVGLGSDISGGHSLSIFKSIISSIQLSKLYWVNSNKKYNFLSLSEAFYIATKSGGSFFGKVGSFEKDYDFDALIIDDEDLNHDNYSLLERLERFIYLGDDRNIIHRYVSGVLIKEPNFK
ncbi:amidohydrolase family protein [Romboutsia sp.]|uniref:amidohydrolase family protein n=1 Tax=Romboutsia sp. TaxID=1965302 RepID=UPI003F3C0E5A